MDVRLARWGNSLAVRVPRSLAAELGLVAGSPLAVSLQQGALVFRPSDPAGELERLAAGITSQNRHDEADWGDSWGLEVW
jgi:antitoxin MazE